MTTAFGAHAQRAVAGLAGVAVDAPGEGDRTEAVARVGEALEPADEQSLEAHPVIFATGWNALLARPANITTRELDTGWEPPRAFSLRVKPDPLKVASFSFPESMAAWRAPEAPPGGPEQRPAAQLTSGLRRTRIPPPTDIVKLQDRLYYLLQPPLETIWASSEIHLPCEPFPYQFQGVAFLYPRVAAILADEMGLGKTMQAITAAGLLMSVV
jgi:hypothetical protein